MRTFLLCLFLTSSVFAQQKSYYSFNNGKQYQSTVSAEAGSFISPWEGYDNNYYAFRGTVSKSGKSEYKFDLSHRSDTKIPIIGNLNYAYYYISLPYGQLLVGRAKPLNTQSQNLSLKNDANHVVCLTSVECIEGGAIGVHFQNSETIISIELLTLPNITPLVSIKDDGSLVSVNRWTAAPVQFVEIEGKTLPVRLSTEFSEGINTFLKPGLSLTSSLNLSSNHILGFGGQLNLSKHRTDIDTNSIRFVEEENGEVIAVANANKSASLKYQGLLWSELEYKLSKNTTLITELGYQRHIGHNNYSILSGLTNNGKYKITLLAGLYRKYDINVPGAEFMTSIDLGNGFIVKLDSHLNWQESKFSNLINPGISYQIDKNSIATLEAHLIRSQLENVVLGHYRGNDYFSGAYKYDF